MWNSNCLPLNLVNYILKYCPFLTSNLLLLKNLLMLSNQSAFKKNAFSIQIVLMLKYFCRTSKWLFIRLSVTSIDYFFSWDLKCSAMWLLDISLLLNLCRLNLRDCNCAMTHDGLAHVTHVQTLLSFFTCTDLLNAMKDDLWSKLFVAFKIGVIRLSSAINTKTVF